VLDIKERELVGDHCQT